MKGTIVVRCASPDTSCRAGNVDTGPGGVGPVDVLTVNGSAGSPPAREVIVSYVTEAPSKEMQSFVDSIRRPKGAVAWTKDAVHE